MLLLSLTFITIIAAIKSPTYDEDQRPTINFEQQRQALLVDLELDQHFYEKHKRNHLYSQEFNSSPNNVGLNTFQNIPKVEEIEPLQPRKQLDLVELASQTQTSSQEFVISHVETKEHYMTYRGFIFLFILGCMIVIAIYSEDWMLDKFDPQNFKIFAAGLKDLSILFPIIGIILIIHYLLPGNWRLKLNLYGVMNYVDLDKVAAMVIVFMLTWLGQGLVFVTCHDFQENNWKELEKNKNRRIELLRTYENLFLHDQKSLKLEDVRSKLQYLLIRQSFITPSFQATLIPQFLTDDFNYAAYLNKCAAKIWTSLTRINLASLVTFVIAFGIYLTINYFLQEHEIILNYYFYCLLVPLQLMLCLSYFYNRQLWIQSMLVHRITSPYGFTLDTPDLIPHPLSNTSKIPLPLFLTSEFSMSSNGRQMNLYFCGSKALSIQFVHVILFLQNLWFNWMFFGYLRPQGMIHYTLFSLAVAISFFNILVYVPKIVALMTMNHNIYGLRSRRCLERVLLEQKIKQQSFIDKLSHIMRAEFFKKNIDKDDQSEDMFDMSTGEGNILKYGFVMVSQQFKYQQYLQEIKDYTNQLMLEEAERNKRQEKDSQPEEQNDQQQSESASFVSKDRDYNDEPQDAPEEQSVEIPQEPIISIADKLKARQDELRADLQRFSEDERLDLDMVPYVAKLCGGNMEMWYHIIFAGNYFTVQKCQYIKQAQQNGVSYSELLDFCGFHKHMINKGFEQQIHDMLDHKFGDKTFITPKELEEIFQMDPSLTTKEIETFVWMMRMINPKEVMIQIRLLKNFFVDQLLSYPQ